MSQENILFLLEKTKKKLSAKQISKLLKVNVSTIHMNLKKLRRNKEIEFDEKKRLLKNNQHHFQYLYWV